jgi:CHRD domain-containing protein
MRASGGFPNEKSLDSQGGGEAQVGGKIMIRRFPAGVAALALLAAALPAEAKDLAFTAALSGLKAPTLTGSKATGQARIVVDTDTQAVDLALDVSGLTTDDLAAGLRRSPMGPIHLHLYGSTDHSPGADAALVFPVPYGPAYAATDNGFRVELKRLPFAQGVALVNSSASFADFVGALQSGKVVLNIHTNRFAEGEISGDVVPAS